MPQNRTLVGKIGRVFLILAGLSLAWGWYRSPPPGPAAATNPEHSDRMAVRGACRAAIKDRLHDPASADFDPGDTWRIERPAPGHYVVYATLRAANAFGAQTRAEWACATRIDGDRVIVTALTTP